MAAGADRRPRIGVTTARRGGRTLLMFNRLALRRAGGVAVRLSPDHRRDLDGLDGLVVGGGDDISMMLYRDEGHAEVAPAVKLDLERDHLERDLVQQALDRGLPVLGICRGAQMINVALGGTLHSDIYEVYVQAPRLRTALPRKTVRIAPDSRLHAILGVATCRVNALHHQSIDRLGRNLRVVAADEWGIVQGIEAAGGDRFLLGVQWHPEFLVRDRGQLGLFRALMAATRSGGAAPPW